MFTLGELREQEGALTWSLDATSVELSSARHRVDALLASASWRWTAPLRVVYRVISFRSR